MTRLHTLSASFDWRAERIDWPVTTDVGPGLAGVVALETRVMWLDPSSGQLAYRGVPIEALANHLDFEEVAFLLITGRQPADDPTEFETFQAGLQLVLTGLQAKCANCSSSIPEDAPYCYSCRAPHFYD